MAFKMESTVRTRAERRTDHRSKMEWKSEQRQRWYERNGNQPFPAFKARLRRGWQQMPDFPASINRHTGKRHEHRREIARRTEGTRNG